MRTGSAIIRVILVGVVAISLCSACRQVHKEQALTGIIEGVVTDSASGEPVVGASVLVKGTRIGATTANSGHFWIKGVPAGTHDLLAMEVSHKRVELHGVIVRANDVTQVSIRMAEYESAMFDPVVQAVEVKGKTYGEIEGVVWDTSIGSPQPVACAIVSLVGTKIQVESGAMGQFHIEHVEPGWQALSLKAFDYDSATDSVFVSVGRVSKVDAILRPTYHDWFVENEQRLGIEVSEIHGCIEGKVTDSITGAPLAGVTVKVHRINYGAMSDLGGKFKIGYVPIGEWWLDVTMIGYETKSIGYVTVREHKTSKVKVKLGTKRKQAGTIRLNGEESQ